MYDRGCYWVWRKYKSNNIIFDIIIISTCHNIISHFWFCGMIFWKERCQRPKYSSANHKCFNQIGQISQSPEWRNMLEFKKKEKDEEATGNDNEGASDDDTGHTN